MRIEVPGLPEFAPGWVWLAGAGPGDPGLLSLAAAHGLQHADVVVYDALVHSGVLALARDGAELVYAGKRGGKPSVRQTDICRRLVELAGSDLRVLRLKGGDPFVFGRGVDECLALTDAGIPFRVIPGITAGIGGLAYAGIPLTARETNTAVTFVTGHTARDDLPDDVDWGALAAGSPVLVFYMAAMHLERIAGRLMAAGRSADEPVSLLFRMTWPEQAVIDTDLAHCAAVLAACGFEPPVLVVVGPVVRLRERLDWQRLGSWAAPHREVAT